MAAAAATATVALRPLPWARGGRVNLYNPIDFDPSAWKIMNLATDAALLDREIVCSARGVEALLLDNPKGTLVTLINWTNEAELDDLQVTVKLPAAPREVFSVTSGKQLEFEFADGKLSFTTQLAEGDFVKVLR